MITATNLETTSNTVVFDSEGENAITTLMLCNHSSDTNAVVNVWVVPGTGSPRINGTVSAANQILKDLTVVAADTFVMDMEKLVLDDKDTVVVQVNTGNAINSVISSMAIEK
jgi:hypothetical protein